MKKIIMILVILIVLFTGLFLTYRYTSKHLNKEKIMTNYLKSEGYKEKDGGIYSKLISEDDLDTFYQKDKHKDNASYEENFYDINSNLFTKKKISVFNGAYQSINIINDAHNKTSYTYTYDINNDKAKKYVKIYFYGEDDPFTCFEAEKYEKETKEAFCKLIEDELSLFKTDLLKFKRLKRIKDIKEGGE